MANRTILILYVLCTLALPIRTAAQRVDAFARVKLSKRQVYVQQPIHVTVSVYTATWFTQPLEFDNLQMANAFIVPFSRTIPGVVQVNGKQYAMLEFYYELYPYKAGSYVVPSINVVAYTPPEGAALGKRITLKTNSVAYTVRDVPEAMAKEPWFVAKSVSITERWNKSLAHVKVGDVLQRTITIHARGTLPNFIPPLMLETPDGASIYPDDARLIDQRDDYDANGTRIETITYLFEREGDVDIAPVTVHWWNPSRQQMLSRKTQARTINVAANPNLGILATVRDSLAAKDATTNTATAKKEPLTIFGMSWKRFVLLVAVLLVVLFVVMKFVLRIWRAVVRWRAARWQKESYWFTRLQRASGKPASMVAAVYGWWDRVQHKSSALRQSPETADVRQDWMVVENSWLSGSHETTGDLKNKLKAVRKRLLSMPHHIDDRQQPFK